MIRRLLSLIPTACSVVSTLIIAVWLASRLATDRWLITQLFFWVPTPFYLAPALALSVIGVVPLRRRRRSRTAAAALLAGAASLAWLLLFEWRLPRALSMPAPPPQNQSLRIVHWNMTSVDWSFRPSVLADMAGDDADTADVFFLGALLDNSRLREALDRLGPSFASRRFGPFVVVSRLPVSDVTIESLGLPSPGVLIEETISGDAPPPSSAGPYRLPLVQKVYNRAARYLGFHRRDLSVGEPGTLIRLTLDASSSLGRPIVIWWIDLPSSPLAPRYTLARCASDRIAQILQQPGVSPPDVLLGDFNIPFASASLSLIARTARDSLSHAAEQASFGPLASWPHDHPLWLIDHLFVAAPIQVNEYRLIDPGISEHRAQHATISARAPHAAAPGG